MALPMQCNHNVWFVIWTMDTWFGSILWLNWTDKLDTRLQSDETRQTNEVEAPINLSSKFRIRWFEKGKTEQQLERRKKKWRIESVRQRMAPNSMATLWNVWFKIAPNSVQKSLYLHTNDGTDKMERNRTKRSEHLNNFVNECAETDVVAMSAIAIS